MRLSRYYRFCKYILYLAGGLLILLIAAHSIIERSIFTGITYGFDTLVGDIPSDAGIPFLSRFVRFFGWLVLPALTAIFITAAEREILERETKYQQKFISSLDEVGKALGMNEDNRKKFVEEALQETDRFAKEE